MVPTTCIIYNWSGRRVKVIFHFSIQATAGRRQTYPEHGRYGNTHVDPPRWRPSVSSSNEAYQGLMTLRDGLRHKRFVDGVREIPARIVTIFAANDDAEMPRSGIPVLRRRSMPYGRYE